MSAERRSVAVRGNGKQATVGWFVGATDESIRISITNALKMRSGAVVAHDTDGNVVVLSQHLPSGLELTIDAPDSIPTTAGARRSAVQRTLNFRGQVCG